MILISYLEDRTFLSKKIRYRHIGRKALALIFKLCIVMYNLRVKIRFMCIEITFKEIHRDVYCRHFRKWCKSRSFKPIYVLRL